jgi:hypothetical protein
MSSSDWKPAGRSVDTSYSPFAPPPALSGSGAAAAATPLPPPPPLLNAEGLRADGRAAGALRPPGTCARCGADAAV